MLKCFLINLVNQTSSERKVKRNFRIPKFECFESSLGDALRTSYGCLESTSQGCDLNVRLGHPLDVISGRPLDVISWRPQDVRSWRRREVISRCLQDGQIGSLGYVLGTLEGNVTGTSWVPIFADWVIIELKGDKIGGTFYKDSLQKTNQTEFRVYKVIKGKVTNYMSNGKATTVLLTVALMKKTSYKWLQWQKMCILEN